MDSRTPAANQLQNWYKTNQSLGSATTSNGNPVPYIDSSMTVGSHGPIVLSDWNLIDSLTHFARERIPERVVHAKGAGAFGIFEVTHDITEYTIAKPFETIGKKTPMAVRFSTVAGSMGSADTVRDPRGFALKFYTEDGLWDLVGNNTPIFFIRDPILFPEFIHTQKANPVTHTRDWDMFWDFISLRPETTHQVMILFSDRGIPYGFRHMHGFGSHTFSLINKDNKRTYCKFHYRTDQGIKNLTVDDASKLAGSDPDFALLDLYNSIASGEFPTWSLYIQTMTEEEAATVASTLFDPFDVTKIWPKKQYPLKPVGKITLNRNAENYFSEIEQLAFAPSNLIPGISFSPDRMLQGRLFSYHDAHIYRIGANYAQLPVNCPFRVRNLQRDGLSTFNNQGGAPNYHPNSFGGPENDSRAKRYYPINHAEGDIKWYDLKEQDNFSQPTNFYENVLTKDERERLVDNIATELAKASPEIQERTVKNFTEVSGKFGRALSKKLKQQTVANL